MIAAFFIVTAILNAIMAYLIALGVVETERRRAAERWLKVIDRMDTAIEEHTRDLTAAPTFTYSTVTESRKGIPCA